MRMGLPRLAVSLWATAQLAGSQSTASVAPTSVTEPCAQVSALWASQKSSNPLDTPTVSAKLAHDCLTSVPLGKDAAIELVDAMVPYLEWQSDTAYKADPPADYPFPAYDIFANLAQIRENLVAETYAGEYEFALDVFVNIFGKGHDGHLLFYPDAMARVFAFQRQEPLVSISEDGTSLPVIKLYEDVISNPNTASTVTHINGIDAATYVDDLGSTVVGKQDKDAIYNLMFFSLSNHAAHRSSRGLFVEGDRTRFLYPGADTTITFANGTELKFDNIATVGGDMTGVVDGASYYAKFCNPNGLTIPPKDATKTTTVTTESAVPTISGFPSPVAITKDIVASCYYLDGEGYEDVVVIALLDMIAESFVEFQSVVQECIADAVGAGKTKLVVDLQANGGGYVMLGYDFFGQLFPGLAEDALSRWKESDGFMAAAQVDSDLVADIDPHTNGDESLISNWAKWYNYRYDYNISGQPFLTFEDKFAPQVYKNTSYTSLLQWNLNESLATSNATFGVGIEITGYGSLSNVSQPFEAENIVLLYDGSCASTCSIFSEMLRMHGGVRSIAMGGRPIEGPIQGVGGIKGAQSLTFRDIHGYMQRYLPYAKDEKQTAVFESYSSLPLNRSVVASLNVRDAVLWDNVEDGLPSQYVTQYADCRLYWTASMITDQSAIWKAAAAAAFNGAPCVAGSLPSPATSASKNQQAQEQRDTKRVAAPKIFAPRVPEEKRAEMFRRDPVQDKTWFTANFLHHDLY